jgi:hypothetical protein
MHHMVRILGNAFAGLVVLLLVANSAHSTEVEARGLQLEGNDYRVTCPPGSFMVGLKARTGDWIDQLWIVCADWDKSSAKLGRPAKVDQAIGASSGHVDQSVDCPNFQAVQGVGMNFIRGAEQVVDNVSISCASLRPPIEKTFEADITTNEEPRDWRYKSTVVSCPDGQLAYGLHGTASQFIYSIGLSCVPAPKPTLVERLQKGPPVGGNPVRQKVLKVPGSQ